MASKRLETLCKSLTREVGHLSSRTGRDDYVARSKVADIARELINETTHPSEVAAQYTINVFTLCWRTSHSTGYLQTCRWQKWHAYACFKNGSSWTRSPPVAAFHMRIFLPASTPIKTSLVRLPYYPFKAIYEKRLTSSKPAWAKCSSRQANCDSPPHGT